MTGIWGCPCCTFMLPRPDTRLVLPAVFSPSGSPRTLLRTTTAELPAAFCCRPYPTLPSTTASCVCAAEELRRLISAADNYSYTGIKHGGRAATHTLVNSATAVLPHQYKHKLHSPWFGRCFLCRLQKPNLSFSAMSRHSKGGPLLLSSSTINSAPSCPAQRATQAIHDLCDCLWKHYY